MIEILLALSIVANIVFAGLFRRARKRSVALIAQLERQLGAQINKALEGDKTIKSGRTLHLQAAIEFRKRIVDLETSLEDAERESKQISNLERKVDTARKSLETAQKSIETAALDLNEAKDRERALKTELKSSLPINESVQTLVVSAIPLIRKMEGVQGRSGSNKREYVYKQMAKDNPQAHPRDISVAIEKGIQEVFI